MKAQRQAAILRLIKSRRVENQGQLQALLEAQGISVTQATLSRDVRELRLAKISDPTGGAFYSVPHDREMPFPSLEQLLPSLLLSVSGVGPLLVARTPAGSAEALGGALDAADWEGVLGTLAGDDTILIVTRSERTRKAVAKRLAELAGI
jgi:transcriptional regulator of arginine metabolism